MRWFSSRFPSLRPRRVLPALSEDEREYPRDHRQYYRGQKRGPETWDDPARDVLEPEVEYERVDDQGEQSERQHFQRTADHDEDRLDDRVDDAKHERADEQSLDAIGVDAGDVQIGNRR